MEIKPNIITNEDIEKVIWLVVDNFLIPKFNELNMNASGEWLGALSVKGVNNNRGEIWGKDYTTFLEYGRPPNKNKDKKALHKWAKWAAATFIKKWVEEKGIDKSLIFPISYSIAKNGTSYYPEGSPLISVLYDNECQQFITDEMTKIYKERLSIVMLNFLKNIK